jgi:hypothetical protein
MSYELKAKMDTARRRLEDIRKAGQKNEQAAEKAFSAAMRELRNSYEKTKAEYKNPKK